MKFAALQRERAQVVFAPVSLASTMISVKPKGRAAIPQRYAHESAPLQAFED
jgi:hypothetical protein